MTAGINLGVNRAGSIAEVTFTDAPSRNALNRATRVELVKQLERLDRDPAVRVIILTGLDPAFTSGVDAKELFANADYTPPAVNPPDMLRRMDTPSIAAVNGICVSGGLEIALACSFIIASERAEFADTHARIGLTPGWGLSSELPAAIGPARARQLSLTAERIGAQTALDWGLVNEVLPHGELMSRARDLAASIAAIPAREIANVVSLSRLGQQSILDSARRLERDVTAQWALDRDQARDSFSRSVQATGPLDENV